MKVAINIPTRPGGSAGGTEQFLIGLVSGLAAIKDDTEYVLVVDPRYPNWIRQYAGPEMDAVTCPWSSRVEWLRASVPWLERLVKPLAKPLLSSVSDADLSLGSADGFFAETGADLVHFPTQIYKRTCLPSLYNPHDIQHEHNPGYFGEATVERRRAMNRAACEAATAVDVPSQFVRRDLVETYEIDPAKIYAIDRGPPVTVYDEPTDADERSVEEMLSVADPFAFYPAKSWPHKNHQRIVEAMAPLRDKFDSDLSLVCTGKRTDHWATVQQTIEAQELTDRIDHLGYVATTELRVLYRRAQFVVIPSLFEGGGFPLLEAWAEGRPVACANTTALPEKAGDAALTFDPTDIDEMASVMKRLSTEPETRTSLTDRGQERLKHFDWKDTARRYSALYRHIAGDSLSTEERTWLDAAQGGTP